MDFNEYQQFAKTTSVYPGQHQTTGLLYCALGAAGEAGEIANTIKKIIRDHNDTITPEIYTSIVKEVGDCLWYLAMIAEEIGTNLDFIAQININKLLSRKERNTLHGSGNDR